LAKRWRNGRRNPPSSDCRACRSGAPTPGETPRSLTATRSSRPDPPHRHLPAGTCDTPPWQNRATASSTPRPGNGGRADPVAGSCPGSPRGSRSPTLTPGPHPCHLQPRTDTRGAAMGHLMPTIRFGRGDGDDRARWDGRWGPLRQGFLSPRRFVAAARTEPNEGFSRDFQLEAAWEGSHAGENRSVFCCQTAGSGMFCVRAESLTRGCLGGRR